jgi:hypothetical protein
MTIPATITAYADQQQEERDHESELRALMASAENIDIMERHTKAFNAAMDAHRERKTKTEFEAALPMYEMHRLVPLDPRIDRDFLNG